MVKEETCSVCSRPLDRLDDLLSMNCGGDCLACMASAEDPECVQHVNSLPLPAQAKATTLHGVTREKVEALWVTIQTMDAKFKEPGVWMPPPMPTWIQLLYLTARS